MICGGVEGEMTLIVEEVGTKGSELKVEMNERVVE